MEAQKRIVVMQNVVVLQSTEYVLVIMMLKRQVVLPLVVAPVQVTAPVQVPVPVTAPVPVPVKVSDYINTHIVGAL